MGITKQQMDAAQMAKYERSVLELVGAFRRLNKIGIGASFAHDTAVSAAATAGYCF